MNKKLIKRSLLLVLMYAGLLVFLFATNPNRLNVGWLILPFAWLFISLFLTVLFIVDFFRDNKPRTKRQLVVAALVALVPTTALLLDSVNQFSLKDGLLILIFGLLAAFYASKLDFSK